MTTAIYSVLENIGESYRDPVPVTLSPEIIGLLSDQLYRSPSKAIEELVVNSYDADADEARVYVQPDEEVPFAVVYDNGTGMTYEGIVDLWCVGRSKVRTAMLEKHRDRKQIGKFGIGKLATYAIANRVTYFTSSGGVHLGVTVSYPKFISQEHAATTEVPLQVRALPDIESLWAQDQFRQAAESVELSLQTLSENQAWTMVVLEDFKPKAAELRLGRLRHVLRTAMPISTDFQLYLNGEQVQSAMLDYDKVVEFDVADLPQVRLDALKRKTEVPWHIEDGALVSQLFPTGIRGGAFVTEKSLLGKSSDLARNEGFFIYVRGRLLNDEDARFGLHELSHSTLNRFRADLHVDDLDETLTANRESVGYADNYRWTQFVLNEIFNEARLRYEDWLAGRKTELDGNKEETRDWVPQTLVERPTADALVDYSYSQRGADADESWMYLSVATDTNIEEITQQLYADDRRPQPYRYSYSGLGVDGRLVEFDPLGSVFLINEDHPLARAYGKDPGSVRLFEDLVTAEALLEVYLVEAGIAPPTVGEVLQRRNELLCSLVRAHMATVEEIADYVRQSKDSALDLEIALVTGVRALGFVAKHMGGPGQPDGLARFYESAGNECKIALEAKSSGGVPQASTIDFATLQTHVAQSDARGCLLLAPEYVGGSDDNTAVAAERSRISCWTVEQFATVVEAAEARHISARQVLDIVLKVYKPDDVTEAVQSLLSEPEWDRGQLYREIVNELRRLESILPDSPRNVSMISPSIGRLSGFENISVVEIERAVAELAGSSRGGLTLTGNGEIVLNVELEELKHRVQALTGELASPRRKGTFAESDGSSESDGPGDR